MEKSALHGLARNYYNDEISYFNYRQQRAQLINAIIESDAEKIQQAARIKRNDQKTNLPEKEQATSYKAYLGVSLLILGMAVAVVYRDTIKAYLDKTLLPAMDNRQPDEVIVESIKSAGGIGSGCVFDIHEYVLARQSCIDSSLDNEYRLINSERYYFDSENLKSEPSEKPIVSYDFSHAAYSELRKTGDFDE